MAKVGRKPTYSESNMREFSRMYMSSSGESLRSVAERYGCSRETVKRAVQLYGRMRGKGRKSQATTLQTGALDGAEDVSRGVLEEMAATVDDIHELRERLMDRARSGQASAKVVADAMKTLLGSAKTLSELGLRLSGASRAPAPESISVSGLPADTEGVAIRFDRREAGRLGDALAHALKRGSTN